MRPSAIVNFERLFSASLVIGVATLFFFAGADEGLPYLESATLIALLVLMLLVSRRRSNVVRWILTAIAVLGVPVLVYPLLNGAPFDAAFLVLAVSSALQLGAVALLWTERARGWFAGSDVVRAD